MLFQILSSMYVIQKTKPNQPNDDKDDDDDDNNNNKLLKQQEAFRVENIEDLESCQHVLFS